jgi:hypothetical protein
MEIDTTNWSGEGAFTLLLVERLKQVAEIAAIRVEDAPASRSEADYNFVSNEIFVAFAEGESEQPRRRFGFPFRARTVAKKALTVAGLEAALTGASDIGAPDYSDDSMLQYLRTERVVPPYQTRGYKLVELVRIYEVGGAVDAHRGLV